MGQLLTCPECSRNWSRPPLTKRQRQLVDYLASSAAVNGYTPSFQEIADRFGFRSLATVHEHLTNLESKGYLVRRFNEPRSLILLTAKEHAAEIKASA